MHPTVSWSQTLREFNVLNLDTPRGSRYQKVPTNTHTKLSYLQYIFETLIICIPQKKETKTPSLQQNSCFRTVQRKSFKRNWRRSAFLGFERSPAGILIWLQVSCRIWTTNHTLRSNHIKIYWIFKIISFFWWCHIKTYYHWMNLCSCVRTLFYEAGRLPVHFSLLNGIGYVISNSSSYHMKLDYTALQM